MINKTNYIQSAKSIDFSTLPEAIQKGHKLTMQVSGNDWQLYNQSSTIKNTVDLYFTKLQQLIAEKPKEKPKEKVKTDPVPKKAVAKKAAVKKVANKAITKKAIIKKPVVKKAIIKKPVTKKAIIKKEKDADTTAVAHLSEEMKLIRRFALMEGKVKTRTQVLAYVRALKKAIKEKKIRKSSSNANLIREIQDKAVKLYDILKSKKLTEAIVTFNADIAFQSRIHKIANSQKVHLSINYLKRFINMQGLSPEEKRAEALLRQMRNAIKSGKIPSSDPYLKDIKNAIGILDAYLDKRRNDVNLTQAALNGLMGIPELASCGCKKKEINKLPEELSKIFTRIDAPPAPSLSGITSEVIQLPGDLGKFLGEIERLQYALLLRGDKGAGKTRLTYQLMNLFASQNYSVATFTLEIMKESDLVRRMMEAYVDTKNRDNISISSEAPKGIDTVREAAKYFDVVVIDSFGKLNCAQTELDRLRNDFPNTFFIIVFQSTTAGTARGGSGAEYDAGAVLQVEKGGMAVFEKNRYATNESQGKIYNVFEQKLIEEEEEEKAEAEEPVKMGM